MDLLQKCTPMKSMGNDRIQIDRCIFDDYTISWSTEIGFETK